MKVNVAFVIKDTDPAEDTLDSIGVIADVELKEAGVDGLIEKLKTVFQYEDLLDRLRLPLDVRFSHGLESIDGALVGTIYLSNYDNTDIGLVADVLLGTPGTHGTRATPQAVALYIKQACGDTSITNAWKGFYNF